MGNLIKGQKQHSPKSMLFFCYVLVNSFFVALNLRKAYCSRIFQVLPLHPVSE